MNSPSRDDVPQHCYNYTSFEPSVLVSAINIRLLSRADRKGFTDRRNERSLRIIICLGQMMKSNKQKSKQGLVQKSGKKNAFCRFLEKFHQLSVLFFTRKRKFGFHVSSTNVNVCLTDVSCPTTTKNYSRSLPIKVLLYLL